MSHLSNASKEYEIVSQAITATLGEFKEVLSANFVPD